MSKTIYLAGAISGLPEKEVEDKFANATLILERQGHTVFNPVRFVQDNNLEKLPYNEIMRECISNMMICDEAHFLPCWEDSKGARIEHDLAEKLEFTIVHIKLIAK